MAAGVKLCVKQRQQYQSSWHGRYQQQHGKTAISGVVLSLVAGQPHAAAAYSALAWLRRVAGVATWHSGPASRHTAHQRGNNNARQQQHGQQLIRIVTIMTPHIANNHRAPLYLLTRNAPWRMADVTHITSWPAMAWQRALFRWRRQCGMTTTAIVTPTVVVST